MKLVIGVDADGVLTDLSNFYLRCGKDFFKKEPTNPNGYSIKEIFEVSSFKEIMFGLKFFTKYCKSEQPRPFSVSVLNDIYNNGHELHEITARKFVTHRNIFGSYYRRLFNKYIKKHNMPFKSTQFCSENNSPRDKYLACKKLGVDVMVEDKPDIALYLAERDIHTILFNAPYNIGLEHPNIIRVNNWREVSECLKKIELEFFNKEDLNFKKLSREQISQLDNHQKEKYFYNYRRYLKTVSLNMPSFKKGERRFKVLYHPIMFVVNLLLNPKVINNNNIPYQDGLIIVSNHLNSNDQYLIGSAFGNRSINGFAASTIEKTFRGNLFKFTENAIFIDRDNSESKKNGVEEFELRISSGMNGLIFPEGTRKDKKEENKSKQLLEFKLGAVAISQRTGSPIIPIALSYGKRNLIRVGEPIIVEPNDNLTECNSELYNVILKMVKENTAFQEQYKI